MTDAAHSFPAEDEARIAAATRLATRKLWLRRVAIAVLVVALAWTGWYLLWGRDHVSTDDAYVGAEVAEVTPLVTAPVSAVLVTDTQFVHAGQVLVRLDPADAEVALAAAEADLATAQRKFHETRATGGALGGKLSAKGAAVAQARAQLAAAQADAARASIDLARRQALASSGAVSGEELTAAQQAAVAARASVAAAQSAVAEAQAQQQSARGDLAANQALVAGVSTATDPGVLAAMAKLDAAKLDVARLTIRAPIDGVVTRRQVQLGQRVTPGVPIMTIVPIGQAYVDANFKEGQLRRMRVGMPASVEADIYGGAVTYHGRVAGIGGGTGAAMAIIPAQNATGNWIKVVQRVPVRITLDPRELAAHPLRMGLSTNVTVDLSGGGARQ
ncbi:MAG: efflux RND transporter periplasmic adaptor subunit [Sphingomonadales bacterium]|nr:efflux RND transporter periplasmic adaptor subunit [Sphingomonadales bacterium]